MEQQLRKEIQAGVSSLKEAKPDDTGAMEFLEIEIEALKIFMERHHPEFRVIYPKLIAEARLRRKK
jgi:hypothetical protein